MSQQATEMSPEQTSSGIDLIPPHQRTNAPSNRLNSSSSGVLPTSVFWGLSTAL